MNPEPHQAEPLLKLLRWKRHEQPPPDYFNELPERVIARLEAWERNREVTWWRRLIGAWELKPLLAGAYGVAVCGLLLLGIGISQMAPPESANHEAGARSSWWSATSPATVEVTAFALPFPASASSMTPVIKERTPALFGQSLGYSVLPVSFNYGLH